MSPAVTSDGAQASRENQTSCEEQVIDRITAGRKRTACPPETPIGTCMVSPEGACAAHYNFGRLRRKTAALVGRPRAAVHGR
jgi:Hydrogenase formation hypA family